MFDASIWRKLKRGPQIITLKDAALIAGMTGLQSGDRVIDAGAGSGFLAIYLGSVVAPNGKVFTYEDRKEFAELAKRNIAKAGLVNVVELKEKDAFEGFDEKEVDLVTLDMAEAERALPHAKEALRMQGWIAGYLPNVEQVNKFVMEAEKLKMTVEKVCECVLREWKIRSYGSRPANEGLGFTGFLVFARKVSDEEFERGRNENTKANRRERRIKNRFDSQR